MYCVCLTARMAKEKEKETRGEATETRLTLQHETAVVLMAEKRRRGEEEEEEECQQQQQQQLAAEIITVSPQHKNIQ